VFVALLVASSGFYTICPLLHGPYELLHILLTSVQYFFMLPSFINVLSIFAFSNLHDLSWGTKGLESGGHGAEAGDRKGKAGKKRVRVVGGRHVPTQVARSMSKAMPKSKVKRRTVSTAGGSRSKSKLGGANMSKLGTLSRRQSQNSFVTASDKQKQREETRLKTQAEISTSFNIFRAKALVLWLVANGFVVVFVEHYVAPADYVMALAVAVAVINTYRFFGCLCFILIRNSRGILFFLCPSLFEVERSLRSKTDFNSAIHSSSLNGSDMGGHSSSLNGSDVGGSNVSDGQGSSAHAYRQL
jgi:chitin synthase